MVIHRARIGRLIRFLNWLSNRKGTEIIGEHGWRVGQITCPKANGSEIIGHVVSVMAILLLKTANAAIVGHQTHKSGFRWPLTQPYLNRMT